MATPVKAAPPGTLATPVQHRTQGVTVEKTKEVPVWEQDDAPDGSTHASLLVYERGVPVAVAPPTHYHHLADGRITTGYSGGTHYTEVDEDGNDVIVPIIRVYGG